MMNYFHIMNAVCCRKVILSALPENVTVSIDKYFQSMVCLLECIFKIIPAICTLHFAVYLPPHSVNAARCASLIQDKSPTNCDAHLTAGIFNTHSSIPSGQKLYCQCQIFCQSAKRRKEAMRSIVY